MSDMLTVRVTNGADSRRVWHVEPYGDEVPLLPGDVMEVQYECALNVVLDVRLHADSEVPWCDLDGATALPDTLLLNGRSWWPPTA
jgi:hypothetical protein